MSTYIVLMKSNFELYRIVTVHSKNMQRSIHYVILFRKFVDLIMSRELYSNVDEVIHIE